MPVSNNFLIRSPTKAIDLSGVTVSNGGFAAKDVKEGFYLLKPNTPLIIVPSVENVSREIYVEIVDNELIKEDSFINLYLKNKNQHPKKLLVNDFYSDTTDGGIALIAESSAEIVISVTIRQNSAIIYNIGNYSGDEMPIELIVRPIIETGERYAMPPLTPTSVGEENLRKIIDSNGGLITGTKLWAVDQFQDGKQYNFSINPNDTINPDIPIRILLIKIEDIMKCIASIDASDEGELDQLEIATDLIGWVKSRSFYTEVSINQPKTFNLKPTRTRYLLAFDAGNPAIEGYTDTIISSYQKNLADPYEGGSFTFLGF